MNKKVLMTLGITIVIPVALLIFVVRPLWEARIEKLDTQIAESADLLERYTKKGEPLPSQDILDWYLKKKEALGERYAIVVNHLDPMGLELPAGTREPGLYFREKLYGVRKSLEQMAKEAQSSLPENLGFSDSLPDAQEVPILLRKLDVINRVAEILLGEGVSDISLLRPLGRGEQAGEEESRGYRVISIQVMFRSDVESLVGILHGISSASPLLVTRDVRMKELSESVVETGLVVSHILTEKREG